MLVIRRSLTVAAPGKLCLPGGTIEEGETEQETLVREMDEELNIRVSPVKLCWRSVTPWGTKLAWWQAELSEDQSPVSNPDEVAEIFWLNQSQLREAPDVLPSMQEFLNAWDSEQVALDAAWAQ